MSDDLDKYLSLELVKEILDFIESDKYDQIDIGLGTPGVHFKEEDLNSNGQVIANSAEKVLAVLLAHRIVGNYGLEAILKGGTGEARKALEGYTGLGYLDSTEIAGMKVRNFAVGKLSTVIAASIFQNGELDVESMTGIILAVGKMPLGQEVAGFLYKE